MRFWLVLLTFLINLSSSAQLKDCPILPSPSAYNRLAGVIRISDTLLVNPQQVPAKSLSYFQNLLYKLYRIQLVKSESKTAIRIRHREKDSLSYSIYLSANDRVITYSSEESVFYAFNSFIQLIQEDQDGYFIKCTSVKDQPKFRWRGMHLDVSRHFFSVDEVKRFIDLLALYKFNTFHWHLCDDQGWRIEIKKYPKLTEIGGFRDSTLIGHYNDVPRKFLVEKYGGFYTQDEVREIVEYAANRYIDVVPEIEMPGHCRSAIAAYPFLSCREDNLPVPGVWGVFDDIYCSKDSTIQFLKDVLTEVIALFPSEYIHIGGDEAPKTRWKKCEKCQEVMKKNNLKDVHELQSYFIHQIDEFLSKYQKKVIGWDEILEGGLSSNAVVMSWRGVQGGIEAAQQGHNVVMSPTSHCYFDYYQSGHANEPLAIGGFLPLEKVYEFNPIPKEMSTNQAVYVLGGQANLWTEYIASMDHLEYMMFPRAIAMAQSLWSINKPSYSVFLSNLVKYHEPFLEKNHVNFSRSIHLPEMSISRDTCGIKVMFNTRPKVSNLNVFQQISSNGFSYTNAFVYEPENEIHIERPQEKSSVQSINFRITSESFPDPVNFQIKAHSSIGLPVDLVTKPAPKYTNNGGLTLVDGIVAGDPWKGNEWLGFKNKQIEIIIDLTELKKIKGAEIGLLDKNGSWIYLPHTVSIYGAKNKKCWRKIASSQLEDDWDGRTLHLVGKTKKVRFVKIVLNAMEVIPEGKDGVGNIPWTFIDEIQIINNE